MAKNKLEKAKELSGVIGKDAALKENTPAKAKDEEFTKVLISKMPVSLKEAIEEAGYQVAPFMKRATRKLAQEERII